MADWWSSMTVFEKVLWYIAIPFSVLFCIQLIVTFIGMGVEDGDGDMDGIGDDDGIEFESTFKVFTVRNFIIFLTVFGWCGITLYNAGVSQVATVFVSILLGVIIMAVVAALFYSITRLAENGTTDLKNAKGRTGEVYIPIPPNKSGVGKIHITFQGSLKEVEAITEGEAIPRGTVVKVIDIVNNNILLVEK